MSELNKAEKYFENNLNKILNNGHKDRNPRPKYENGEDATSTFITQIVEEYDISKGEIPITETRYIGWKSAINEMLAIYQSQTNTQDGFEKHNTFWWKPWMNEDGNIGRAYAYNLESHRPNVMKREIVKVKKRIIDKKYGELKDIPLVNELQYVNQEVYFNRYFVIGKSPKKDAHGYRFVYIQFINTGNIVEVRKDCVGSVNFLDTYDRTTYGIGFLGDYKSVKNFEDKHVKILKDKWENMFRRCYSDKYEHKDNYEDIFVHQEWHSFEQFLRDIKYIPQFHLALEDNFVSWELDKDYYGSNCYSKDTCTFLAKSDNSLYSHSKPFYCDEKLYISQRECANDICSRQSIISASLIRNGTCNGRKLKWLELDEENVYRYELSRNQINELLNELIHNKFSRRHMTSFFNWSNHNKKMLVECAFETLWTAYEKDDETYLDLTLIQRSSDVLTANHINKIQYVALMMMIARHCGYKCGKFVHFVQNYHIYNSHMDNLKIVLERIHQLKQRDIQSQPKLILNVPDGTNFYDITVDDFELVDYNPIHPQLKFDLAI